MMGTAPLPISGFVDLQVNGYRGTDFSGSSLTQRSFADAARQLLASGTAAFLPTLISSDIQVYKRNLPLIADVMARDEFAGRILGIHIEGPFISDQPGAVGAHAPEHVQVPDPELFDKLVAWSGGHVRLMTLAAEAEGAVELIQHAVAHSVTVSIGHSLAGSADLARAAEAGATALTHLGNGIPKVLPRHPNPIWAGLAQDGLEAMIITDGHHVPVEFIKTVIKAQGPEHVIVTSDAASISGLPPGKYEAHANRVVLEENGRLHNPETGYLVGSSATMMQCMNYLASLGIVTLEDLLSMGYYNPLRLIGAEPKDVPVETPLFYNPTKRMFVHRE